MPAKNAKQPARKKGQRYPSHVKEAALARLAAGDSRSFVARDLDVDEGTLNYWRAKVLRQNGQAKRLVRSHTAAEKARALERVRALDVKAAAEELGINYATLYGWAQAAGIVHHKKRGVRPSVEGDVTMEWMRQDHPQLEDWRRLGEQWIREQGKSLPTRLKALRNYFRDYLVGHVEPAGLPTTPAQVLSRANVMPDFFDSCLKQLTHAVGRVRNNYVREFLDWVLMTELSVPDDNGRPVPSPAYFNPVAKKARGGGGQLAESVRSPLPYGYIEELRSMLAMGPDFKDWTWAQSALGGVEGRIGGQAADWFAVTEEQLDKLDPDCVWRVRMRGKKAGGPILEMWSPVRWVALLLKLTVPLRTVQVRLLDSGEADTWRYDTREGKVEWSRNPSKLREGTERKPYQQGVFRRLATSSVDDDASTALLYINTNKTADAEKSGSEKGYELPWFASAMLHSNPFYWLEKLRNWQEKYNPVSKRTPWSALDANRLGPRTEVQLAGFLDSCFLFRTPEDGKSTAHLPLSERYLDVPWHRLLAGLEDRLASRGETLSDGSRVTLVRSDSRVTTHFPLHSLRVSLVTALALEGQVPFPILQKIVGHSRLVMTLYYTKIGATYSAKELEAAAKRLEENADAGIVDFLRNTEYKTLVKSAICNSPSSLALAIEEHPAARNAAGWMPMHHGACLVGGNTSPMEGNNSIGGCYNGGANIGTTSTPRYAPTPGGARNCVRCRWFVTEPHHLPALGAHLNNIFYHFNEAQNASVAAERKLGMLKAARSEAEERGAKFDKAPELRETERVFESAMQRYSDLAQDAAACVRLMQRCVEQQRKQAAEGGKAGAILAVGSTFDVQMAIEEVDSELLQLVGVCDAAEVYPDIQPGKAVFRRSQLLDAALMREGLPPLFMSLSEEEQLLSGNSFMRKLAAECNPSNPALGQRQVVSLMDAREGLSAKLGIDLEGLLNLNSPIALERRDEPLLVEALDE